MALLERRRPAWAPVLAIAFLLVLTGCGSPEHAGAGDHGPAGAAAGHHMEPAAVVPIELPPGKVPRLALSASPDPMGGWNLQIRMANFRLAPEHTGEAPVPGEGHLHLYVDGVKHTRLYGSWFYLDGLAPGDHALRVEAVASNHAPYHHDGEPISATTAVSAG